MWTFKQSTGQLTHNGEHVANGYAGHGAGVNNPSMESVARIGPLPQGFYAIGPEFTHPHTGPISMRLSPDPSNQMFGRGGFLMHGDNSNHTASEGCIVMPRDVRVKVSSDSDKRLQVIA